MPTIETKFGVGDRVSRHGQVLKIDEIRIDAIGPMYLLDGAIIARESELSPAPPAPEVWPKVDDYGLRYSDGKWLTLAAPRVARGAKLERLAYLVGQGVYLTKAEEAERDELIFHFRRYHGPNGEVYLEPREVKS